MGTKMEIRKDEELDYLVDHIKKYATSSEEVASKFTVKTLVRIANHLFLPHKGVEAELAKAIYEKISQ